MDAIQESGLMDPGEFIDPDELAELLSGEHGMLPLMAARELVRTRGILAQCRMTMAEMAAEIEIARRECMELRARCECYSATIEEMSIKLAG